MRLIPIILLAITFSAVASEGWYENGKPVEDTDWRKHDGSFKAHLFFSDNPESIYKEWNSGPANRVTFKELSKIESGRHFEAVVVFAGCNGDKDGRCVVVGDWTVKAEDGRTIGAIDDAPIYDGPGPTVVDQLLISTNGIGLPADKADGGYFITVKVKDVKGKHTVTLQRFIDVE